mmetsp:Transcript_46460/g.145699  ORF Transcript_46460/g.145699 Transcript_46460/m.145699 type:complete len:200 (-) Transcript_46460:193-792(-)
MEVACVLVCQSSQAGHSASEAGGADPATVQLSSAGKPLADFSWPAGNVAGRRLAEQHAPDRDRVAAPGREQHRQRGPAESYQGGGTMLEPEGVEPELQLHRRLSHQGVLQPACFLPSPRATGAARKHAGRARSRRAWGSVELVALPQVPGSELQLHAKQRAGALLQELDEERSRGAATQRQPAGGAGDAVHVQAHESLS